MGQDLRAAARDSKIQAALGNKVSRERIGAELSGMLTGKVGDCFGLFKASFAIVAG